jgi:predicted nucleic acid-binding Zn finger protein
LCTEENLNRFKSYDKLLDSLRSKRFVVVIDSETGLVLHVFKGVDRDYIVSPCKMCTCSDFVINFLLGKRGYPCYHVIGFHIALKEQRFVEITLSHDEVKEMVLEIVLEGFSKLLRRALSK